MSAPARALGAITLALAFTAAHAAHAVASDDYPCGREESASWSSEPVQLCPLTAPLAPNNWVPVYKQPVANPQGSQPPAPDGWLHGTSGQRFRCQLAFTHAVYYHPRGWRNYYWAHTRSDDGIDGWVPEVFFKGGNDDERDAGLRMCPSPPAPSPPAPSNPPPPSPPAPSNPPPADPASQPAPPENPCDPTGPSSETLKLRARFERGPSARTITARYGRRLRVSGSLMRVDGAPLAGTAVCIAARDALRGAGRRSSGAVNTDAQGRFSYAWQARKSRRLWFIYRRDGVMTAASVRVRVPAPVTLRAARSRLRNGQTMELRGRLEAPRRGAIIEIQARRRLRAGSDLRWQTIGTARAARRGRFGFRWRFANSFGRQDYTFRALVPAQPGYAFATGRSRIVRVTVNG